MKERPILFGAPMVRASLAGTKTQTRRVVKLPADAKHVRYWAPPGGRSKSGYADPGVNYWTPDPGGETDSNHLYPCPYGQPGDRLWVRETWQYYDWTEEGEPCIRFAADNATSWPEPGLEAWGDKLLDVWEVLSRQENFNIDNRARDRRWRPSIHMPRWASRITLEVTSVRVERLQDISEADALAEGVTRSDDSQIYEVEGRCHGLNAREAYANLWEQINGPGSVDANPLVWVIEFKRVAA